jgi:DNA polymerase-1
MTAAKKEVKTEKKKRLVVLDTHAILHRAYHALPDFSSSKGEPTGALYGVVSMITRIITDLKPDYIIAAYDLPGPTYRHAAYEQYKAQRKETDSDLVAQIIRSRDVIGAFGIPMYDAKGFEADDVIGTIAAETKNKKDLEIIIASGDMDMLQLLDDNRVEVYRMRKGITDLVFYTGETFKEEFGFESTSLPDYKGLRGDTSDNIPGVKGVGEKTAKILIANFATIENLYDVLKKNPEQVAAAGMSKGMMEKLLAGEEDAQFSKMLAQIRTDAPINFEVPKKTWKENVEVNKVLDMLAEFDFRSLLPRVKQILGGEVAVRTVEGKGTDPNLRGGKSGLPNPSAGRTGDPRTFSQEDLEETETTNEGLFADEALTPEQEALGIAVSVLDSTITTPTLSDIYRMGKSKDIEEARKNLLAEIKEKNLEFVYEKIELPLAPVLRKMEERGIKVDKEFLKELSKTYTAELAKLSKRIYEAAGGEFNVASPKQLGEVLFDKLGLVPEKQKKTAGGQRSTKESELVKMRGMHPIIEDILSYRELSKLLSTYIDTLPTLLDSEGRVHTTFIQIGAATGRLASQNPNLQNIPIKTELGRAIRHAFVADKGSVLVAFDYSQIELRIAAFLSGDEALTEIFTSGRDVHTEVAARVFHVRESDVTYEMRRRAKVINFGILYGMGVNALRESLGTSRGEAQEFYDQYFAAFPRLAQYIEESKGDASRLGYTETFFGRRRYLDGIHSSIPYVRAAAERMAINAPIQGTQADIVKLAMIKIDELGARLLLQVHDELVIEIEEGMVKELAPKIQKLMEGVMSVKDTKGISLRVEGKIGKNWGEMKPL